MKSLLALAVLLAVVLSIRAATTVSPTGYFTATTENFTTPVNNTTPYTTQYTPPTETTTTDLPYIPVTTVTCCGTTEYPTTPTPTTQSQLLCPSGWEASEGRCYYFVTEYLLWSQAQSYCAMLDSTLASVHSPQEYGFLQQLTNTNGQSSAWLGGFYLQYEWLWLDGSWFFNTTSSWSFQNPDSSNPCLQLNTNEGWSNSPCNIGSLNAICAKDSNIPQMMMCPEGWSMFGGRCYYYETETMSWTQADTNCASLDASLVSVHSPQEYAFLQQLGGSSVWLGGFYFQNQWMWLDGSWFYQGFFTEMSFPDSDYACLTTYGNNGWTNFGCERSFASICVKDGI